MKIDIKSNPTARPVGRDSPVGIATRYGRTVRGSVAGGARFSAPIQTAPGAHPASYKLGVEPLAWG